MAEAFLPTTVATTSALGAVGSTANTAATNATAALAGLADKADVTTVVNLTGSQTVTGPKDFASLTVSTVPVATTGDLADYVPTAQAATFDLDDYDTATDTGDVVIHAGTKDFTFTYLAGVLQGGTSGSGPGFDEGDITNEWGHATVPHTTVGWPDTIGGVDATFATGISGASTGYDSGADVFMLENDEMYANLGSAYELNPGVGYGCAYVVYDTFGMTATADGTQPTVLAMLDGSAAPLVTIRFLLNDDGVDKTYYWLIKVAGHTDVTVPVGALPGLNEDTYRVNTPTSIALVFKGASSYLSVNGAQVGSVLDLSGTSARYIDLNPYSGESGLVRGFGGVYSFGWSTSGFPTAAACEAWVADRLAAASA